MSVLLVTIARSHSVSASGVWRDFNCYYLSRMCGIYFCWLIFEVYRRLSQHGSSVLQKTAN